MRAGAVALLLTAGTGLAGLMSSASAAVTPPAPVVTSVSPAESFVSHAYYDLINHPADAAGKAYWVGQVNAGKSHAMVAAAMINTDAYRQRVVADAYLATIGRYPDAPGMQYWTGRLAAGVGLEQLTGSLAGSPEYAAGFGTNYDAYVRAIYQTLLGRLPEPAGQAFWVGRLATGIPMWNVAASISHTAEWYGNEAIFDFVHYHNGFPDGPGLSYWTHALQTGTNDSTVVAALVGSPAYAAWAATHP
ncbi:MAG TPA: DUF4214 domain-containing protein [Candidatus Dormibacteraeota bacterium]